MAIRSLSGKVLPVYPATEGLSHKIIRSLIDRHLDALSRCPQTRCRRRSRAVHGPSCRWPTRFVRCIGRRPADEAERGRRRLAFDELLDLQLMLIRARAVAKRQRIGVAFEIKRDLTTQLRQSLPWELTARPAARAPGDHRRHDGAANGCTAC